MAIQISGTTVIDNDKRLAEGLESKYSGVFKFSGSGFVAINNGLYVALTDGLSVSLPAFDPTTPLGNQITFCAAYSTLTTGLTVLNNGNTVMGSVQDIVIDVENAFVKFTFVGGTIGWQVSM